MSNGVFISYRRSDSEAYAGRLFDHLDGAFSNNTIFMDVDSLEPGIDFAQELENRIAASAVMLVVIGDEWAEATLADGTPRLHDPNDFVRMEIENALQQDCRVIPVLVGEAEMPASHQLPESLHPLLRFNAVQMRHARFHDDAGVLTQFLEKFLGKAKQTVTDAPSATPPVSAPKKSGIGAALKYIGLVGAGVFAVLVVLVIVIGETSDPPPDGDQQAQPSDAVAGSIRAHFEQYVKPEHNNDFMILAAGGGKFVQFTAYPEDPTKLMMNLPRLSLEEQEIAYAEQFFANAGRTNLLQNISDKDDFYLIVPRDAALLTKLTNGVFTQVFGYNVVPDVTADIGS